jgi:signal transduction histidine kinase/CheY-like chemotaxis protein
VTSDEVGVLANSFNAMTVHLRTLYADLNDQVAATSRMVDALQKNRTLMQSIVDNSTAAIAVIGFSDQVLLVNRRLTELGAPGRPVAVGKRLADFLSEQNAATVRNACQAARLSRRAVELELHVRSSEGPRVMLTLCFPLFDDDERPYAIGVIATDHTERRRAEEDRQALEAQVRHGQKLESLGVMAGGIAHDFNNILGAVLGHAELAIDALDQPAEARCSLEQVVAATRRASDLTRQMLAYAGKASFGKDVIELNTVVREISELASVSMSKKLRVVHEFSMDPTWVLVDGAQVSQVILNLLTNAADAIGDREGSITVSTSVAAWNARALAASFPGYPLDEGRYVALTVVDTGDGMEPATLERIFDPFFTTKASGRGLGLAAVLGIVRSSSGGLAVRSVPARGTTFTVIFPCHAAPEARRTDRQLQDPEVVERRHVLVADDEVMLRQIASRALRKAGFEVIEAADGVQALAQFHANRDTISAVILDMTMPGMSGQEVLAAIRRDHVDIPVVLSSGYDSQDSAATRAADPRVQFLQKPYAPRELVSRVAEAVAAVNCPAH